MARRLELVEPIHRCEISVRSGGDTLRYSLDCDLCGYIGTVATMEAADNVARLHEDFVAPLLKAWSLPS